MNVSARDSGVSTSGGEGGIRTHGGLAPTAVFKTAALNHSATSPREPPHIAARAEPCKPRDEPSWPRAGFSLASDVAREGVLRALSGWSWVALSAVSLGSASA